MWHRLEEIIVACLHFSEVETSITASSDHEQGDVEAAEDKEGEGHGSGSDKSEHPFRCDPALLLPGGGVDDGDGFDLQHKVNDELEWATLEAW